MNLASALCQIPDAHEEMIAAYKEAITRAEQQLTINSRDADVLSNLADCYAVLGERNRALSHMLQALSLAPDDVEVMSMAGIVYERLGERDTALVWVAQAINGGYQPSHIEALPEMRSLTDDPRYQRLIVPDSVGSGDDANSQQ